MKTISLTPEEAKKRHSTDLALRLNSDGDRKHRRLAFEGNTREYIILGNRLVGNTK